MCELGDHTDRVVVCKPAGKHSQLLFDLAKQKLPYLEDFKQDIGFFFPEHGFRTAEQFSVLDLLQLENKEERQPFYRAYMVKGKSGQA